jgi:hypothetical protein
LTNTAASSVRFYYENAHAQNVPPGSTTIPLGLSHFGDDYPAIRPFAERDHKNIISWNIYDRGDHFSAHTAPDLLINDIRTFFQKLRLKQEAQS